MLSPEFLVGKEESEMVSLPDSIVKMHREVVPVLQELMNDAKKSGFQLEVVSGFRSFSRQLVIWNEKAQGKRAVLDESGAPLPHAEKLSEPERERRFFAMLRWSAFPGLSRHHWGSDCDVIDRAACPEGYQVQLTPAEVDPGGIFAPMHEWLDSVLGRYDFFRPYREDRGGVSPERWHLSYAPLAQRCLRDYDEDLFKNLLTSEKIEFSDLARKHRQKIWEKYFLNTDQP